MIPPSCFNSLSGLITDSELLFESPETSQVFLSLPGESRAAWEENQPQEVVRAKQLLDKGGAGVRVECHYLRAFIQLNFGQRGSEESPGRTPEVSREGNNETLRVFQITEFPGLETRQSSFEHCLLIPSTHKAIHNPM